MCGIAGIVKRDPYAGIDEHRLRLMGEVIAHRGPDGEGTIVRGPAGLTHRRLAIIDVAGGAQPMSNEDGSVWIVYNGEIYNHAELRPILEACGHRYRTRSDTETILHLYEQKGDGLVDDLRGMFAFAIWDDVRRRLLLARDRLGIKPLYYAVTDDELIFGSEIKALLAAGTVRPSLNERAVPAYLSNRFLSSDQTFFDGILKLPPGHVLTWSVEDGLARRRYWQLPAPSDDGDGSARVDVRGVRERLEAAVNSHLMSDVPLGVFLSGGIDSTAIAALVARAAAGRVQTFSVGFDDPQANELPYARLAAESLGTEHRDVTVTPAAFFEALPFVLWHEDEPVAFPSSVPLYFVARLAREHVKVVLTGEGADELFLGYNRYRVTHWNARFGRLWAAAPATVRDGIRRAALSMPASIARVARRSFLALDPGIRDLYFENFAVLPTALQRRLLRCPDWVDGADPYGAEMRCYDEAAGGVLDRLSSTDCQTYLVELLMRQDQMSMAASIESRVPFLDDRLVEYVAAIPGRVRLPGWQTKALLRAAARDLIPRPILTRRKMGFPVPLGRWFQGAFRSVLDELVGGPRLASRGIFEPAVLRQLVDEQATGRAQHADRLWLLANLEIWFRIFIDRQDPAEVSHALRPYPRLSHANSLGENGRPVAGDDRWTRTESANPEAALRAPLGYAGHDARP